MRDYGKVFSTFWTSDDTRSFSDDAKVLALYLLTGPHTNMIGCFRLPDGYVSEDLSWTPQRVAKGFDELFQKGFATRDSASKWVTIHKYLKWNPLENPNQAKAAVKMFEQIPVSSCVKFLNAKAFFEYAGKFFADFETVLEPFRNPSATVLQPEAGTGSRTGTGTEAHSPRVRARFEKPAPEQVCEYCRERGNGIDGQEFWNFYESKGWLIGKSPMKDWRAAVGTWERNRANAGASRGMAYLSPAQRREQANRDELEKFVNGEVCHA